MTDSHAVSNPVTGDITVAKDPASRLPPELMARCLLREHDLDLNDLVRASHVSRHWRSIALSEPILWSKLHVRKQPGLRLMFNSELLERSGAVPLDVTMTIDVGNMHWAPDESALVTSAVSQFWSRIEYLDLTFDGDHDGRDKGYQARFDFLRLPAPTLKVLRITDYVYADEGSGLLQVNDDLYWRITDDFLGGGGALEMLDVTGAMLQLPNRCPALSTISSFRGRLHEECSIPEHLPLLCPKLHHLVLRDVLGVSRSFSAGNLANLKGLKLFYHGPPETCNLPSQLGRLNLPQPIPLVVVTATCWTLGNVRFLARYLSIHRLEMKNLLFFAEQTDETDRGHACYANWDKSHRLFVTDILDVPNNRMLMQRMLALGPSYQNIRELSLGFDLLLPFLELSPTMPALVDVTMFVPAGQYDADWRDGRFIVGPRRLLVQLELEYHQRVNSSPLPLAMAPSDDWRATFNWHRIAHKLPALKHVQIQTRRSHRRGNETNGQRTFVCASEVKALVELGLGRHTCEPRTLAKLAIVGIHFVDSEAETLLDLSELAEQLVIDQAEFGVATMS